MTNPIEDIKNANRIAEQNLGALPSGMNLSPGVMCVSKGQWDYLLHHGLIDNNGTLIGDYADLTSGITRVEIIDATNR